MNSTRFNGTFQNGADSDEFPYDVENSAGRRARRLRLGLGYTRSAFADMIDASVEALDLWESSGKMAQRWIDALSDAVGVDRQWLATGQGRAYPRLLDSAAMFLLAPNSAYLSDEHEELSEEMLSKTRVAIKALTPAQRERALLFFSTLLVQLAALSPINDKPF